MSFFRNLLLASTLIPLAACGADDVASPGEGTIVNPPPAPAPTPSPTPTPGGGSGPAASCPAQTVDRGVLADNRVCEISGTITGNRLIQRVDGVIYQLAGRVQVGTDRGADPSNPLPGSEAGTLTIDPGVVLFGSGGLDFLIVNRGSQLIAEGTANNPIVFTSRQNIEGAATDNSIGQFGGLVILGRAPIQRCNQPNVPGGSVDCQSQVEGTTGLYGGATANDSSGRIRYVQVRYPGFQVSEGNELNGITLAGVGSGTTFDHVQVHNSSDDGIEWFGGTVNGSHLVLTGNDDDSLDTDFGYKGANQFVLVVQRASGGDHVIEADTTGNGNSTPRSYPKFANFTAVGRAGASDGWRLRGGTDYAIVNTVLANSAICLDIDEEVTMQTTGPDEAGPPSFRSVHFSCATAFRDEADVPASAIAAIFGGNNNVANGTSSLQSVFVNGPNETAVTATDPTSFSTFFQFAPYIGAVRDAGDLWFLGWTCGLGFTTPSCTVSPAQ